MNLLHCDIPNVTITKPNGLAPKLFFHAYNGVNEIAFAQLSSRRKNNHRRVTSQHADAGDKVPGVSYCLKIIEVSQNYRSKGIGSALLDEIIRFCEDERVSSIYGEAKGEMDMLRHWYQDKGFNLDSADNIQLALA